MIETLPEKDNEREKRKEEIMRDRDAERKKRNTFQRERDTVKEIMKY